MSTHINNKNIQLRRGFSLLMAVFIIILMSTITALIMNTTSKVIKETSAQYRNEQSRLLAKSYTELAIMAVMGHDRSAGDCVKHIDANINTLQIGQANPGGGNINNGGYTIDLDIQYIGNNFPGDASCILLNPQPLISLEGPHMLIDVYVKYRDPDQVVAAQQDITYHRRTLQKL
jgi:hypothetical protein